MLTKLEQPYEEEAIKASLTPLVQDWFGSKFPSFSPPQKFSILNIKKRKNTLISSPTGSGKTLSSFLAIIDDLIHQAQAGVLDDRVYCVYISPLKALGNDIEKNLIKPLEELNELAGKDLGIRVGVRTGDTTPYERQKMLKKPPHILITTPESFAIMLTTPKFSALMKNLEWVVIDEVHALAENKRGTHLALTLERLASQTYFTRIGLSATVAPLEEVAKFLVGYDNGEPRDCDIVDVNFAKPLDIEVLSPVKNMMGVSHELMMTEQYDLINKLVQEHKTTIIFTNTRAATERVVHQLKLRYSKQYTDKLEKIDDVEDSGGEIKTIAAHHGSLSKEKRLAVEQNLRDGKLKCVVSSTSLELGIDVGFIDLVILLGSPKSVARALQRIGRSGHKLHETAKGRIVVLDRDDLVECSVLARAALNRKIDRIHIPVNCLDVLSQEIYGIAIKDMIHIDELFKTITRAYPYADLDKKDFMNVIKYLSGEHASLEERHVYAKIWYDKETGQIGRKGKLSRVMYMSNIGTIPDQTNVVVKIGMTPIGTISEPFLESLKKGDVFVLGGETYEFRYSRGMTAQVVDVSGRRPTVPSWFSEMLPLSFDLANDIQAFRKNMDEILERKTKEEVIAWLKDYLPVDDSAANSIHAYFTQQKLFTKIPHQNRLIIEYYTEGSKYGVLFHSVFGRRVNDVLSRAVAYALGKLGYGDVEIGISDNGFVLRYKKVIQAKRAFSLLKSNELEKVMMLALEKTEVLRRRFRHCAGRALMILRTYKGHKKTVGRQQVSSQILINAVKRVGEDFPIWLEAKREVLQDLMDLDNAIKVMKRIESGSLKIEEVNVSIPSPFAFSLALQGYSDIMKMEERHEFLRRMHNQVLAKIALQGREEEVKEAVSDTEFSYDSHWDEQEAIQEEKVVDEKLQLKEQLYNAAKLARLDSHYVYETQRLIEGDKKGYSHSYVSWLSELLSGPVPKAYDDELVHFLREKLPELGWE